MLKILQIINEERECLVQLKNCNGEITIEYASPGLKSAVNRWLEYGISDWVGPWDDRSPRTTLPTDENFFEILAEYIHQQSGLFVRIID